MKRAQILSALVLLVSAALGSSCIVIGGAGWRWGGETATGTISSSVDRGSVAKLLVLAGAGSLEVRGEPRADLLIEGTVTACARTRARAEEILEQVDLVATTRGDTLRLESEGPRGLSHGGYSIDLFLRVPSELAVEIRDGSGGISVDNVHGGLRIVDGSGEIELTRSGGEVRIEDGSGEILIEGVDGPVEIHDGSGCMRIVEVVGDVGIWDGSGSIRVDGLRGNLRIHEAGSGSVSIGLVSGTVQTR
jgi:hypothetical protein